MFHVLVTPDVHTSREFYERQFEFRAAFVSDWYVQLVHPSMPSLQLGLVVAGHESLPSPDHAPAGNMIVTLEVEDADAAYRTLVQAGAPLHGEPRNEPWGQRHFFLRDPAGYWVDVVQPIAPSPEYAAAYQA